MKAGYLILIAYLIVALYIMYRKSQSAACKIVANTVPPLGGCNTWNDIVLPGLTLGLYQNKPSVVIAPAQPLTDEQKCGPTPLLLPGAKASCIFKDGKWQWEVTGGSGGGPNSAQRVVNQIFGIK